MLELWELSDFWDLSEFLKFWNIPTNQDQAWFSSRFLGIFGLSKVFGKVDCSKKPGPLMVQCWNLWKCRKVFPEAHHIPYDFLLKMH